MSGRCSRLNKGGLGSQICNEKYDEDCSQGIRRFDLRRSRHLGLARTHLQQLFNATAINVVRVIAWLRGEPLGERRRKPGHLAQLAPYSLSRQAVHC